MKYSDLQNHFSKEDEMNAQNDNVAPSDEAMRLFGIHIT